MAHAALTHGMKLSPPEATQPLRCGICLCAEVKEEKKKKRPRGTYGGKTTSTTIISCGTEWINSLQLLNKWVKRHQKEQLWRRQEGSGQGLWCQACRPQYKPGLPLNSCESLAVDFTTLCLSFPIYEMGIIKLPTIYGYLRLKRDNAFKVPSTVPLTQ